MATVFGEPEGTRSLPCRRFHADLDQLGTRTLVDQRHRTRRHHRLGDRVAAPAHRARAPGRPPGRPPRPRRRGRRHRHRRHWANTTRQTKGTPNAASSSRTPWTATTSRSGTRWPPATSRKSRRRDREGCRRAPGRAPPRTPEAHLIGCAAVHDPIALRRLAHHVLEVVAPEIAEAHELQALQRQEALAEEACRFTIADDGHGLCHGRFTLPSHVGAMLKQAVLAITHPNTASTPEPRRGSGTRSASTSPATRSTGSPRPAASTPPSWSR